MLPTFNIIGDWVMTDYLFWKLSPLERDSLMVFVAPYNPDKLVVKRLVGLPGDEFIVNENSTKRITVPPGHVWMLGDNLLSSRDSRSYGPVPIGLLKGKIMGRIFSGFSFFNN